MNALVPTARTLALTAHCRMLGLLGLMATLVDAPPVDAPQLGPTPANRRARSQCSPRARRWGCESGQATAEYALIMLGAATIALLVVAWATRTNLIGRLLTTVMDAIQARIP